MARLVLLPVADRIESGTYLLYEGACGTGGMLTVADPLASQGAVRQTQPAPCSNPAKRPSSPT
jgi:hypothetical protein